MACGLRLVLHGKHVVKEGGNIVNRDPVSIHVYLCHLLGIIYMYMHTPHNARGSIFSYYVLY